MKVDIEHELIKDTEGVYIVWTGSIMDDSLKVLYIGQGYMYDEIRDLRVNPDIMEYSGMEMFIAWAETKPFRFDGIEAWLNVKLKPEVKKDKVPSAMKIKVNLPWNDPEIQQLKEQLKLIENNDDQEPESKDLPW
jgi:hypothetical protein